MPLSSDSDSGGDSFIDWDALRTNTALDTTVSSVGADLPTPPAADSANGSASDASTPKPSSSAPSTRQLTAGAVGVNVGLNTAGTSDAFIDHITHNASTPVSLLVESLVQQLCSMLDADPQRSTALYLRICEQLHQMRLIDGTYAMGEFELMRSQYQRALYQLVTVARGQELPLPVQSVWPLTQPVGMDWSRYHREFEELAFVAGGGFGKVFRARHRLDGIEYAVKKVTIRSVTIGRILSHLAEVKTLAGLNHQNVVAYKAAWLEPLLEDPAERRRALRENGETTDGDEGDEDDEADTQDDDEEEESNFTASVTRNSTQTSASVVVETDTENGESFIQFESESRQISSRISASVRRLSSHTNTNSKQLSVRFNDQQPHLNLKWATLYIQMTLCQQTLREWLDARNQQPDFGGFYADFRRHPLGTAEQPPSSVPQSPIDDDPNETLTHVAHEIFAQLVTGLEYIHSRGIIHHDIKPSNVFIGWLAASRRLSVQLGDFGLACPLQVEHSSGNLVGTPTYAAPEQLRGSCDPKSDVFSLGVVLVELLMPFGTAMERIRTVEVVRRAEVPDGFPAAYAELLLRLVATDPAQRPTTAAILQQLAQIQQVAGVRAAQLQVDALGAELQRLRDELEEATRRQQQQPAGDSPSLRAQLGAKDDELRTKNNEIYRLQRQLVTMRRSAAEARTKDAEIRRLRAALRRKNSRSDDVGGANDDTEDEAEDEDELDN